MWDGTDGVEGSGVDGGVDLVGTGDGVGREESDDFIGREVASVLEPREDRGDVVLGLRDQTVHSRDSLVRTTSQELELRSTLLRCKQNNIRV